MLNSLQRGTLAVSNVTSADTTITSVNTSKTVVNMSWYSTDGGTPDDRSATAKLLNATTVRAEKNTAGGTTSTPAYEVVEFL